MVPPPDRRPCGSGELDPLASLRPRRQADDQCPLGRAPVPDGMFFAEGSGRPADAGTARPCAITEEKQGGFAGKLQFSFEI